MCYLEKVFDGWEKEFNTAWEKDEVEGWQRPKSAAENTSGGRALSTVDAVWCEACEREFKNENVYKGHLNGKKHINASKLLGIINNSDDTSSGGGAGGALRLKEDRKSVV